MIRGLGVLHESRLFEPPFVRFFLSILQPYFVSKERIIYSRLVELEMVKSAKLIGGPRVMVLSKIGYIICLTINIVRLSLYFFVQ